MEKMENMVGQLVKVVDKGFTYSAFVKAFETISISDVPVAELRKWSFDGHISEAEETDLFMCYWYGTVGDSTLLYITNASHGFIVGIEGVELAETPKAEEPAPTEEKSYAERIKDALYTISEYDCTEEDVKSLVNALRRNYSDSFEEVVKENYAVDDLFDTEEIVDDWFDNADGYDVRNKMSSDHEEHMKDYFRNEIIDDCISELENIK